MIFLHRWKPYDQYSHMTESLSNAKFHFLSVTHQICPICSWHFEHLHGLSVSRATSFTEDTGSNVSADMHCGSLSLLNSPAQVWSLFLATWAITRSTPLSKYDSHSNETSVWIHSWLLPASSPSPNYLAENWVERYKQSGLTSRLCSQRLFK